MNRPAKKSYWNPPNTFKTSRNAVGREMVDDIDDDDMTFEVEETVRTRQQVINELAPQVFTGQAQPLFPIPTNTGLSSSIPFTQSQFLMYGALFAGVNRRVLSRINGQGPEITGPNAFIPDAPGGLNFKIPPGQFFIHLAPAVQSPKLRYLLAPQNIADTGGNDLACNGLAGRIIVLICGESTTFTVDPRLARITPQTSRQIGVYFSSFPVGGTNASAVNSQDGSKSCSAQPNNTCEDCALPGILADTTIMWPGTTTLITPTANWGFLAYLCCTAGFSMYCPVVIVTLAQTTA